MSLKLTQQFFVLITGSAITQEGCGVRPPDEVEL